MILRAFPSFFNSGVIVKNSSNNLINFNKFIANKTVKNKITILAFSILLVGSGWQNEFSPTVITNFFICLQVYLFIKYS